VAGRLAAGLACLLLAAALPVHAGEPEPEGYRGEPYRAPVPETLEGAVVVDGAAAHALWWSGAVLFVDVLPRPPKPENLPEGTLWRDRPHASIPGAIWLPNTGYQGIDEGTLASFLDALGAEAGSRAAPVLFFCLRDCWMSWNAAKRALEHGFERVFWYPDGTDAWLEAGRALEPVEPYDTKSR
jgi:PQQ-dependent catabolism-associated CXXCW motif protein